ncbi:cytochrome P450 [Aulographum hederae CBS 113979]|uniref:Cytochrome P450 n=1 Tax=Aulographum hederae CBS 113979 TaxID=1176131 RepID=A0A6G1HG51_9PEZI|nr:cytochrome P450 [Aulographum hederae CBS 113979]
MVLPSSPDPSTTSLPSFHDLHLPPYLTPTLLILLLYLLYRTILHPIFLSPLSKIPNAHPLAPITPLWILYQRLRQQESHVVHAAHVRLGPVVRIGPSEISATAVDDGLKALYAKELEKSSFYSVFENFGWVSPLPNAFSTPHFAEASKQRQRVAGIYSKAALQACRKIQAIDSEILYKRLLRVLSSSASQNAKVDVTRLIQATVMDLTTAYMFGCRVGTNHLEDAEGQKSWLRAFYGSRPYLNSTPVLAEMPGLGKWLKSWGFSLISSQRERYLKEIDAWCLKMIDGAERVLGAVDVGGKLRSTETPVVYKHIKEAVKEECMEPEETTVDYDGSHVPATTQKLQVASELLDELIGTQHNTSTTLIYLMWQLSRNPQLQSQLRNELISGVTEPLISYPEAPGSLPCTKQLDKLPFLNAVIKETLRLHPPQPGAQRRVTPLASKEQTGVSAPTQLAGFAVPGGTQVNAYPWAIHRNADVFPSPEEWLPQRWMPDWSQSACDVWATRGRMESWFWAFGNGSRMCVGHEYAWQTLKIVVAAIYTNFRTTIATEGVMEQKDGFMTGPMNSDLLLQFEAYDPDD